MVFSRQESWSGLPFPSPEDLPDSGIKLESLVSATLAGGFFTTKPLGKPSSTDKIQLNLLSSCWVFAVDQALGWQETQTLPETYTLRSCRSEDTSSIPGQKDSLEEEMATHSRILAWRIPWTEEPGRLKSIVSKRVGHDWSNLAHKVSHREE